MTQPAAGTFDVKIAPQTDQGGDATVGRMALDKRYHGDLDAASLGQMLTAMGEVKGSAVYVAVERVRGTLHGRRGTFALYHVGVMDGGAQRLTITVAPDSGTGALTGLTGTMHIDIRDGVHAYTFDYTLASPS